MVYNTRSLTNSAYITYSTSNWIGRCPAHKGHIGQLMCHLWSPISTSCHIVFRVKPVHSQLFTSFLARLVEVELLNLYERETSTPATDASDTYLVHSNDWCSGELSWLVSTTIWVKGKLWLTNRRSCWTLSGRVQSIDYFHPSYQHVAGNT